MKIDTKVCKKCKKEVNIKFFRGVREILVETQDHKVIRDHNEFLVY